MNEAEFKLAKRRRHRTDPVVLLLRRAASRLMEAAAIWPEVSDGSGHRPEELAFYEKARKQEKGCRSDAKSLIVLAAELERRQARRREAEDDDG